MLSVVLDGARPVGCTLPTMPAVAVVLESTSGPSILIRAAAGEGTEGNGTLLEAVRCPARNALAVQGSSASQSVCCIAIPCVAPQTQPREIRRFFGFALREAEVGKEPFGLYDR